jgi:hypothetical protein
MMQRSESVVHPKGVANGEEAVMPFTVVFVEKRMQK